MKLKNFLYIILLFTWFKTTAQEKLSSRAFVSVLTCGPGAELYTAFGHSAFRVSDPLTGIDKVYNYGTFNFNAPNFYLNFVKGKLIYELSVSKTSHFLWVYKYENRWVDEQILDLKQNEVQEVYNFLENNAKPENKSYKYDFFYDNCSTKIEDVIKIVLNDKVNFNNNHITTNKSHRDLIADYTNKSFKWGKFGIDLALGSVIDDLAIKDDYKFLPDYIFKSFENATIKNSDSTKPMVKKVRPILKEESVQNNFDLFQPLIVFSLLLVLAIFISYKNLKKNYISKWFDFLIYFITGIVGLAVLLLWFATDHTATYKNFNFLWAFAPNLLVAFFFLKSKLPNWIKPYNKLLLLLIIVMIGIWLLKIQVFNLAIIPILLILVLRYLTILKVSKK